MNRFLMACMALLCASVGRAAEQPHGKSLFVLCSTCHGNQGQGLQFATLSLPAIAGLPAWYTEAQLKKFQSGLRGAHARDTKGLMMRPMSRTLRNEEEIKAIAAFVEKLPIKKSAKRVEGNLQKGKFYYESLCASCHGDQFQGNADPTISAPSHKPLDDWYMIEQLKKFQSGIRGTHSKDVEGARMLPIIQSLLPQMAETQASDTDQAMKDVVAFIYSNRE